MRDHGFIGGGCDCGGNYLAACAAAAHVGGVSAVDAALVRAGLLAVLNGSQPRFQHLYTSPAPGSRRWIELTISAAPSGGAVLAHQEVTGRHLSAERVPAPDINRLAAAEPGRGGRPSGERRPPDAQQPDIVSPAVARINAITAFMLRLRHEAEFMRRRSDMLQAELARCELELGELRNGLQLVRDAAITDQLTGLGNRRQFDHALARLTVEAVQSGQPLSLLLLDVDHFKLFNDLHGHATGDRVLRLVAERLSASIRARDLAIRHGGEEFAVLLPRTDLAGAIELAERIRDVIATTPLDMAGTSQDLRGVTVSIGAVVYAPGESLTDLVARADGALYAAKRQGRNRTVPGEPVRTGTLRLPASQAA